MGYIIYTIKWRWLVIEKNPKDKEIGDVWNEITLKMCEKERDGKLSRWGTW